MFVALFEGLREVLLEVLAIDLIVLVVASDGLTPVPG